MRRLVEILLQYKPSKRIAPEQNDANGAQSNDNNENKNLKNTPATDNEISVIKTDENLDSPEPAAPLTICDSYIRYKNDKANRWKNKRKFQNKQLNSNKPKSTVDESEIVCSVIFVKSRLVATVIHYLLSVGIFKSNFKFEKKKGII